MYWNKEEQKCKKSPESRSYEEQLRSLRLFSLEKSRLRVDCITLCNCRKRWNSELNISLFSQVKSDRIRGNVLNLYQGRFWSDIRIIFFSLKGWLSFAVGHQRRWSPFLEVFKIQQHGVLRAMVYLTRGCSVKACTLWSYFSNLSKDSIILYDLMILHGIRLTCFWKLHQKPWNLRGFMATIEDSLFKAN